jgi:hypothetical protein
MIQVASLAAGHVFDDPTPLSWRSLHLSTLKPDTENKHLRVVLE